MGVISKTLQWINEPFKTPLDTVHIGLLVLIVMLFIVLWSRVLVHLGLE